MSDLLGLGRRLLAERYSFVTVTPTTHARVLARRQHAEDLRDVFGWNLPMKAGAFPEWRALMAGALQDDRSTVRFSTLGEKLFLHSGFPTTARDAVFFGPDTYRFVRFLEQVVPRGARRLVEVGCGTGAAAIHMTRFAGDVVAADINARALEYTTINATLAGVTLDVRHSDVLAGVDGDFDVVIANPPYLVDDDHRAYRDGGGALGLDLTLRIAAEGFARAPFVAIYSATPILSGHDPLRAAILATYPHARYEELDPDVFGEELERPAYAAADRIAVVGIVLQR